ncbi:MAG: toll/interleukin-1 receptor domain-containing protein [Planctomycetota bacterium]|jgi:WD40 repeat protein
MAEGDPRYQAFISYSHRDAAWGDWLHRALESYRIPAPPAARSSRPAIDVPERLYPIFRDREELPTSSDLGSMINEALADSRHLIVLCSPHSAVSRWVNEEITTFCRLRSPARVHRLVIDGDPEGREGERACYGEALRRLEEGSMPLAIDVREHPEPRNHAKLALVAALTGLPFEHVWDRDAKRRHRRLGLVAGGILALLAFAIPLAALAVLSRREAKRQEEVAVEARDEAGRQRSLAEAAERERRAVLAAAHAEEGWRAWDTQEDAATGLLWHVEALRLMSEGSAEAHAQRIRVRQFADRLELPPYLRFVERDAMTIVSRSGRVVADVGRSTIRIFDAHTGEPRGAPIAKNPEWRVTDLLEFAWAPDDRAFAMGHGTTILVWDVTGPGAPRELSTAEIPERIRFGEDGERLFVQQAGTITCLRVADGRSLFSMSDDSDISSWAWSRNGARCATGHADGRIRVWDATDGALLQTLTDPDAAAIESLSFGLADRWLVSADANGRLRLWRLDEGRAVLEPQWLPADLFVGEALFLTPDPTVLALFVSGHAAEWDPNTDKWTTVRGEGQLVPAFALSPDFGTLAVGGQPQVLRLLARPGYWHRRPKIRFPGWTFAVRFDGFGDHVTARTFDGLFGAWSADRRAGVAAVLTDDGEATAAAMTKDARLVATGSDRGFVTVWEGASGKVRTRTPRLAEAPVQRLAFSSDEGRLLIHLRDPQEDGVSAVWIWEHEASEAPERVALAEEAPPVLDVHFTGDGGLLALHADGVRLRGTEGAWTSALGGPASFIGLHRYLGADGRTLVVPDGSTLRIVDVATGETRSDAIRHDRRLHAFAIGPRGERIATASHDATARVWDARTGEPVGPPLRHQEWVFGVAFDPGGERLVTGSADRTAVLWDVETGARLLPAFPHHERVVFATFDPTGRWIATVTLDGSTRVWDAESGRPLSLPLGSGLYTAEEVLDRGWRATEGEAYFDHDGGRVLVLAAGGSARLYPLSPDERSLDELTDLAEFHAAGRLGDAGELQPLSLDGYRAHWERVRRWEPIALPYVPESQVTRFWRLVTLSEQHASHAAWAEAEAAAEAALETARLLEAWDPGNPRWIVMHVSGLDAARRVQNRKQDWPRTAAYAEEAVARCESLYRADPSRYARVLGNHYGYLGFAQFESGHRAASLGSQRRALELRREEAARSPDDLEVRFELGIGLAQVGRSLDPEDPGQRDEARRVFREALEVMRALGVQGDARAGNWLPELENRLRDLGD